MPKTGTAVATWTPSAEISPPVEHAVPDIQTLVTSHFEYVWRLFRRLGLSEADADDAAQRTFVVAARKLDKLQPGSERAYLFGIAVRVASRAHRALARRRESHSLSDIEFADPSPSPDEVVDRGMARQLLDRILAAMTFELRAVFVMYELEGLTVPQIALALEIPEGTAASRLRRGREQFEQHVQRFRARESFRGKLR